MEVREIIEKDIWETFVLKTQWTPFFQSWAFGEAQKLSGQKVYRLGVIEKEELIMVAQVFVVMAKRGNFLHLRHAPLFINFNKVAFQEILTSLKELATKHKALYIRISPLVSSETELKDTLSKFKFIDAPIHNQDAENCSVLSLTESLETIQSRFRKKTRYYIRKAEKLGVIVKETENPNDLDVFFNLYKKTASRETFVAHRGILEEYQELKKCGSISLYIAYYNNEPLSASLVVFYGKQAVYHHSGSILNDIPVNYLLQWRIIQDAKARGFTYYNMWGIAPEDKPNHPWQGFTQFKRGFGGDSINFLHAKDLPLSPWYYLSYMYQKLWAKWRGY